MISKNGLEKYNKNFHDLDGRLIQPDLRIGFVLIPGFTILPLAGFMDMLRHAADAADHSHQVYCKLKWPFDGTDPPLAVELQSLHGNCMVTQLNSITLSYLEDKLT